MNPLSGLATVLRSHVIPSTGNGRIFDQGYCKICTGAWHLNGEDTETCILSILVCTLDRQRNIVYTPQYIGISTVSKK